MKRQRAATNPRPWFFVALIASMAAWVFYREQVNTSKIARLSNRRPVIIKEVSRDHSKCLDPALYSLTGSEVEEMLQYIETLRTDAENLKKYSEKVRTDAIQASELLKQEKEKHALTELDLETLKEEYKTDIEQAAALISEYKKTLSSSDQQQAQQPIQAQSVAFLSTVKRREMLRYLKQAQVIASMKDGEQLSDEQISAIYHDTLAKRRADDLERRAKSAESKAQQAEHRAWQAEQEARSKDIENFMKQGQR